MYVGFHLPYVIRYDIIEAAHEHEELLSAGASDGPVAAATLEGIESLGKSSGLGDLSVYGLWRFYEDKTSDTNVGLIGGVKTPTGDDDEVADTGGDLRGGVPAGQRLLGSLRRSRLEPQRRRFSLAASTVYTLATEGS